MKPTLGRIVHYMEEGHVFPALIVGVVQNDPEPIKVQLVFWNEFGNQNFRSAVAFSRDIAKDDRHWFWPPMPKPTVDDLNKFRDDMMKTMTTVKPGQAAKK